MAESLRTRLMRWRFNLHPAYRGSGARITYIDAGLREVRLRLPLCRRTRNLNGTIYGGSMYSAVDPIHAVMLVNLLGPREYVGWTKSAHIRFLRQARTDLTARITLSDVELQVARDGVRSAGKFEQQYTVNLIDAHGHDCAVCELVVHIHARPSSTGGAKADENQETIAATAA